MVPCRFSLDLQLFGLGPLSKGHGFNLSLSANRVALFHWTLDIRPSSKVAFSIGHFFFQSEAGIQNCTKPSLGIKADDHGYHKKYLGFDIYIIIVIKK
jgi:hypothetical protein